MVFPELPVIQMVFKLLILFLENWDSLINDVKESLTYINVPLFLNNSFFLISTSEALAPFLNASSI